MSNATDHHHAAAPWTRLWRTGVLHSCASGIDGNYDDGFARFWLRQFEPLHEGARIIDVGTGNGAIPLLAQSISQARNLHWQLHGVDIADIDPPGSIDARSCTYQGIAFHPNTSMTELPFGDGAADLICSQFAFEYAPRDLAITEILRVIGTHGRAALVMHSEDSLIHTISRSQWEACHWLLQESDVFDACTRLLRHIAQATDAPARRRLSLDPAAESARTAFNAAATQLMERIELSPDAQVLQTTAQALGRMLQQPWQSPDDATTAVQALRAWAQDEQARLGLMLEAVLDGVALQDVVQRFAASGLPCRTGKLMYRDTMPMGWTLEIGHE
ncbi:class I SAM-dependent methyltransferase [Stenotrophomonas sp.]|uniref:class I SAM-dependent methyltransferase n=1 Tax=Stenotrophomonas sp. TaxID=69392 RepID=UPI0028ADFFC9|nr:class I SAM-dependent methyltransferase [Stenotrophomonas sp.]